MKTIFWFLVIAAGACAAIPFMPLATAIDLLQLQKVGFEAEHVEGNLWEGRMYAARLAKIELGDVMTKLSFDDISKGRLKFELQGSDEVSRLGGAFSYGMGGAGIDNFTVGMPAMAGPPPIGGVTLIVDGLKARFPDGECQDASGEARVYLSGALPAVGLPSEMQGPVLCREGKLTFDMASSSGREQESVTILSATKYKVRAFIKPTNSRVEQILRSKGFQAVDGGYSYEEERTL